MSPRARKSERLAAPSRKRVRVAPRVVYYTADGEGHPYGSTVELEAEEAKAALEAGLVKDLDPKA